MPTSSKSGRTSSKSDDDPSRRDFMKLAGMASAGALGTLSGCAGGNNDGSQKPNVGGASGSGDSTSNEGGQKGSTSLSYWSAIASETPTLNKYFKEGMREFEEINNNKVTVNLQALSHDNLKNKFATTIESGGGVPDFAMSGSLGLQQYRNKNVIDHGPYIEETEGLPDNWTGSQTQAGQYRGNWWAAGAPAQGSTQFGIVNEPFKQIGITDPHKELKTWTQMRRAFEKIKAETDYDYPYEVTGTPGDVEAYWGNARTSYKDGTDPWLDVVDKGTPQKPVIKINGTDRTDGMIYNEIELGENYSSPGHPSQGDEDVYPMMLQGQVASQAYSAGVRALKAIDSSIKFGWDGQITAVKAPKLDPNYGDEFGIPELAGKEGMHGGHTWTLETQLTIQEASKAKDEAWELAKFRLIDKRFLIPLLVKEDLNQSPSTYKPIIEIQQKKKYTENRTQPVSLAIDQINEYGENFRTTGAVWDVPGTSTIRMSNLGDNLSRAYADEFPTKEAPAKIEQAIRKTLTEIGSSPQ